MYKVKEIGSFHYMLNETTREAIVKALGLFTALGIMHIEIPEQVTDNGIQYDVIGIADDVFLNKKNIFEIVLPSTMQKIGKRAFANCTVASIERRNTSYKLYIEDEAFAGCPNLQTITFGGPVCGIGENCFNGCKKLENVESRNIHAVLKTGAFKGCSNLQAFWFNSLSVMNDVFADVQFETVTIADKVQSIDASNLPAIKTAKIHCSTSSQFAELAYDGYNVILE